jgi:hypothetical protein
MDRCIRKRPIRSGRCGSAAQPVDAAPAVTAAIVNPTIEDTLRAGAPASCRCWREHDHLSAPDSSA